MGLDQDEYRSLEMPEKSYRKGVEVNVDIVISDVEVIYDNWKIEEFYEFS